MNSQIEEDKFSKENEKIKAKIESVEKEINEDLALIPEYQLLQVYSKINKIITEEEKKFTILKNKFIFIDKTLTGYINLKDFYDILNNNLSLEKDELKILLCDPALRNKINPNLYQYKPFLTRISDFNENDIIQMRQEYNIYQNKYITELRNNIKVKNIDIKKLWENTFRDNTKCTKNNFYLLFNGLNSNYSYHYLELEYIFDLIKKKDEDFLSFEDFNNILGKSRGEDLRVVFFKKIKEQREKEKKKEEEKREKERLKKKKLEEAKKKLIYDNSYLFAKKKKSINFILRKEIEEIVHGGILIQQLANKEEEHNTEIKNRFLPPKRAKFVKKKRNRAKLFRKSKFLNDVMNTVVIPKQENNYSSSISEIKEESNHSFEDKMQTLIDRVKKLRKGEELNLNEIEKIMNQKNVRNKKEKEKEIRMQGFMNKLNEYRDMNKSTRKKYNNFAYKVPILIMANSEGD